MCSADYFGIGLHPRSGPNSSNRRRDAISIRKSIAPITPREAATLQSFPSTFNFVGSYTSVSRQIGEAVPPVMARAIADHVAAILSNRSACETSTARNERQEQLFQESLFATASSAHDAGEM